MTLDRPLLRRLLPDPPALRYTVLTGTNTWEEWCAAGWRLLTGAPRSAVEDYEAAAARLCGCAHAFSLGAGRMGLFLLLEALGLEPGDQIILPPFTCSTVPNAMIYRRLQPVYADINPTTFNIDPDQAEAAVTPRTRALYMQHTFGVSCDVARLREVAARHGLVVIEDLAHSLGARHQGQPHGALGDIAYFSSDRSKVINTHLGGCVTTSDDELAARLRTLRDRVCRPLPALTGRHLLLGFLCEHFWRAPALFWLGRPVLGGLRRMGMIHEWKDEGLDELPADYPYPSRLPPEQAWLGASQLARLRDNLRHRVAVARLLEDRVGWYGGAIPGRFEDQAGLRYSFLVEDRDAFERRFGRRLDLGTWFPHLIFGREHTAEAVGYRAGSCPGAEAVARHIVNLPTHPRIPLRFVGSLWDRHGDWVRAHLLRLGVDP